MAMNPMLFAAAVAVAAFAVYRGVLRRWQRAVLPVVSDDEFLREYGDREGLDHSAVLRERLYLSRLFSVPADRLTPMLTFKELQSFVEPIQFTQALSDLEDDIYAMHRKTGEPLPSRAPTSVGEAIDLLLAARGDAAARGRG